MQRIPEAVDRMAAGEFGPAETHGIGFWPGNRVLAESVGRGWRNVYAALATVNSWSGELAPTGHPCLAYCVRRPAQLRRRIRGSGGLQVGTVQPRQFLMIPAHEATEWHRHGSSDMMMLYLRQDFIDSVARECRSRTAGGRSIDLALGATDPLLEQLALAVLRVLEAPEDGGSALYVDSLVHTLAAHLLRLDRLGGGRADDVGPGSRLDVGGSGLRRTLDLVEAELDGELTVAKLAREAGLLPQTFARSFSRAHGTTVRQYVLQRRVEKAKHLLASTDVPIVDVALQTGFSSQSHLSTSFQKRLGVTPARYRALGRE